MRWKDKKKKDNIEIFRNYARRPSRFFFSIAIKKT